MTTGKRSVSLDLRQPLGPRGARRPRALVRRRHRVVLAARPGGARPRVRRGSPRCDPGLVMMSSCLFGQSGPLQQLRRLRHDGRLARRVLPPHRLARPPAVRAVRRLQRLPVAALRALCALLAALDHRRRTGEGQYLDFAQAEACVHFLSPAVLDQSVNGRAATRQRQRRHRHGAARRVPERRRRRVGRDRLPRRRRLAGARRAASTVPTSPR